MNPVGTRLLLNEPLQFKIAVNLLWIEIDDALLGEGDFERDDMSATDVIDTKLVKDAFKYGVTFDPVYSMPGCWSSEISKVLNTGIKSVRPFCLGLKNTVVTYC